MSIIGRSPPIDLSLITAPLPLEKGVGKSLKYEPIYDQIKKARREEDAHLSQGIWQTEVKKADWPLVEKLCLEVLTSRSKDLQVAIWLTEGWTVLDHLSGTIRGMTLLRKLCQAFWSGLYPTFEGTAEEGIEQRQILFELLDKQISNRLLSLPLIETGEDPEETFVTLSDWRTAFDREVKAKRSPEGNAFLEQAKSRGEITLDLFYKILNSISSALLGERLTQVSQVQTEVQKLRDELETHLKMLTPSFSLLRKSLEEITRILNTALQTKSSQDLSLSAPVKDPLISTEIGPKIGQHPLSSRDSLKNPEGATSAAAAQEKIIADRSDAYQALRDISRFLKSIDPQSVTPTLLEVIATWEYKSLLTILKEVKREDGEGYILLRLLGQVSQTTAVKAG